MTSSTKQIFAAINSRMPMHQAPYPDHSSESLEYQIWDTQTGQRSVLPEHAANRSTRLCEALEAGAIIYFPVSPVMPNPQDLDFLLAQRQLECPAHKNIAYKPLMDKVTGVQKNGKTNINRLHTVLQTYSKRSGEFLNHFLPNYTQWPWDYATFRPIEEQGRRQRLRARNDLLHVDSFPTRPLYGGRILRFFTNINPNKDRVWATSYSFEQLAKQFRHRIPLRGSLNQTAKKPDVTQLLQKFGLKASRYSAYDAWMTNLHNAMKEDSRFQKDCPKQACHFPPGSAWMVMTDTVSHAVLAGQHALEQTVIIPPETLITPEKAPINILRQLYS